MSLWVTVPTVNRSLLVAVGILVVGLAALTAAVVPTVGCDTTYGLELTERTDLQDVDDGVVNVSVLPADAETPVRNAVANDTTVTITESTYLVHLDDRLVAVEDDVYEPSLVVVESCGGPIQDGLLVFGTFLSSLGMIAIGFGLLYGSGSPPIHRLHLIAAVMLLVGATVFASGVALPAGCTDNYALETTEIAGTNETNSTIVDASDLPRSLEATVEQAVTSNQTAFLDRAQYRDHLEARAVRDDDRVYTTQLVLVQDCGGGLDDALLLVGLLVATLGAVALSLLVLYDHGEKVL